MSVCFAARSTITIEQNDPKWSTGSKAQHVGCRSVPESHSLVILAPQSACFKLQINLKQIKCNE